jgi:nucleoid-associated protein YgaU
VTQTITVIGGNLWAIAAQYLDDATQANRLAQLNGITDPFLNGGTVTLVIPDPDPTQSGGLPIT